MATRGRSAMRSNRPQQGHRDQVRRSRPTLLSSQAAGCHLLQVLPLLVQQRLCRRR